MARFLVLAACGLLTLGLSACASDEQTANGRPRESAIPWNRPASWEGAGVYGSAINQQQ